MAKIPATQAAKLPTNIIVESKIKRLSDLENRLIELLRDDELKRFLLKYKEVTGKDGVVVLTPGRSPDNHVLMIDRRGIFVSTQKGEEDKNRSKFYYEICRKYDSDAEPVNGWNEVEVVPQPGEIRPKTAQISSFNYEQLINQEFLFVLHGGGQLIDSNLLDDMRSEPSTPGFIWDEGSQQFVKTTKDLINRSLVLGLDSLAQEIRGKIGGSSSVPKGISSSEVVIPDSQ